MANLETPALVFDQRISDLRDHASQANIDAEMRQLDAGQPRARIALMANSGVTVMRGEYERAYHKIGATPRNVLSIGVPDHDVAEFRWCGKVVGGNTVTNFGLDNGFDGTCAPGFSGFAFSIDYELLDQMCDTLQLSVDFRAALGSAEVFRNSECLARILRQQAVSAFASCRCDEASLVTDLFNFTMPASILSFLASGTVRNSEPSRATRVKAARAIREYLDDADDLPLTVAELCSRVGVSAPTLYRAFQDEFGLGPKQYIQYRRLNAVRDQLLDPASTSKIVDAANKWGFWHMGKFAADYRQLFGERPSETLAGVIRGPRFWS